MTLAAPPRIRTNFASDDFQDRLHDQYSAWQRDTPVFINQEGVAYLTRYDDCASLLGGKAFRRRLVADRMNPFDGGTGTETNALDLMIGHWMLFMDPPRHDVVRQAFAPLFTVRALGPLEPRIRDITQQLLRSLRERESADAVAVFASPLPMLVICEAIGIPAEDQARLLDWSARLTIALDSGSPSEMSAAIPTSLAIRDYLDQFLKAAARGSRNDFSGILLSAAEAGDLTREELVCGLAFLILAGHETTRNLLGNGMLALSEHPAQLRLLKERPDLTETAVEELLRYSSPVQKLSRWTSAPAQFGSFLIPEATLVAALLGAANRDPGIFERPHDLDLRRTPNRHLAFGKGLHACLGAILARLEGRIAFEALAAELTEIGAHDYRWRKTTSLRGLDYLMIRPR